VSIGLEPHFADGWSNDEARQLGIEANRTLDIDERKAKYARLQELFVQDLPIIVVQETPRVSLTSADVTGWEINSLGSVWFNHAQIG